MSSPEETNDDLDIKIGQMLIIGFRGLELQDDNPIVQDIRERHIGGVVLFDRDTSTQAPIRNIQSPEQMKCLTSSLQALASLPLFIGIDQEGGHITRLKEALGFPATVSAQYLGHINQVDVTKKHADTIAATLADLGINLNFAPVVDLNINPHNPIIGKFERSFSDDSGIVITHALEWIKAHHSYNVCCALKHFPGHGSALSDSHYGFVDITDTWSPEELMPYSKLIPTGECDMIMTAHIFNSKLDPHFPATLSKPIITGLLRNTLHYEGVVISDYLQMKAITSYYTLETVIQSALEAGVDLLMFGNNVTYEAAITARVTAFIKKLVLSNMIRRDRIERSYRRIQRLKKRLKTVNRK